MICYFVFRSSYKSRYFVLPCCLWDFNTRFTEKARGESQYTTYLSHVKRVGEVCGFEVKQDTLRIPSTKRVCVSGYMPLSYYFTHILLA